MTGKPWSQLKVMPIVLALLGSTLPGSAIGANDEANLSDVQRRASIFSKMSLFASERGWPVYLAMYQSLPSAVTMGRGFGP